MSIKDFENIELYLGGELTEEEKAEFKKRLASEPDLKAQLDSYKKMNDILEKKLNVSDAEYELRKKLNQNKAIYFKEESKIVPLNKKKKTRWLSITALAAAAILVLLLWSPWQENILDDFGQIEMVNPTVRGNEQNVGMMKAANLFNRENYRAALPLLDSAVNDNPANAQTLFYRGVTLMHLKKETEAQQDLEVVFKGESVYRYEAAYFMALTYLQKGDKESCRTWLQKIPDDASIAPKAQKLLQKVGK